MNSHTNSYTNSYLIGCLVGIGVVYMFIAGAVTRWLYEDATGVIERRRERVLWATVFGLCWIIMPVIVLAILSAHELGAERERLIQALQSFRNAVTYALKQPGCAVMIAILLVMSGFVALTIAAALRH